MRDMHQLYDGFVGTSVSEVSLTQQMMKTVRTAVLAGCTFGEEAFPIIRSLMYMDGMVLSQPPRGGFDHVNGPTSGRLQGHHARGQRGPRPHQAAFTPRRHAAPELRV
ncbi:MAG: hypothetical protein CM15mP128_2890 [Methanobacteriota archaeon]|nr:MAG: hypothetical protein CM15mP128_2890 [Euryarchaeota archaeon]